MGRMLNKLKKKKVPLQDIQDIVAMDRLVVAYQELLIAQQIHDPRSKLFEVDRIFKRVVDICDSFTPETRLGLSDVIDPLLRAMNDDIFDLWRDMNDRKSTERT
jgi:hypothetical protein